MDNSNSEETDPAKKTAQNDQNQDPINDEPKEKEVEEALNTIGASSFLKETTESNKGDAGNQQKLGRKKQLPRSSTKKAQRVRKEKEKRLKQAKKEEEQKKRRKIDESDSPSTRTRGANQRKLDEAYQKMKETRKRKVDEGEPAGKDFVEVSEDENKREYKRKKAAGKRKVDEGEATDKEFVEVSEDENKKEYKRKKAAGKRKVDEGKADDDVEPIQESIPLQSSKTLRARATSAPLFEAMRNLTAERKRMIREMGFGELIDFPIGDIPTKLAYFVVNSLETKSMCLKLPKGDIPILPETVHKVIGIPMGERPLERQEGQREYDDPFIAEWKSQFPGDGKRITTRNVSEVIVETTNTDFMFKMNFLMLFANTMGCCDNSSCVKNTVLNNVLEDDDVREIDWCTYIWECARYSKHEWAKRCKPKDVVYYGPITFLMLVYLHYTKFAAMEVRRRIPAFKSWNSTLMKKRETLEINKENIGKLKVIGEMNEEEQNLQKQDLYQMIKERIENIVSDKEMLEQTIEANLEIYKDDKPLKEFKNVMWHLFKQTADHFRDLNSQSSSHSTPTTIVPPETDSDDDSVSLQFVFQQHNPNEEQVADNDTNIAESGVVDATSVQDKNVMVPSDDENEEENNDEEDVGEQGDEGSDNQEKNDDEDDAGNQGPRESGQQEGSGKNEDAGNEDNNSGKKDDNEGNGTKEATNQKNEAGITEEEGDKKDNNNSGKKAGIAEEEGDLTDSQMFRAVEEKEKETEMYTKILEDCDRMVEQRNKEKEAEKIGPSTQSPSVPFIPGSQPTFDLGFDFGSPEVQSNAFQKQQSDDEQTRKNNEEQIMKKRKIKPSVYLQSPYIKKKVKVEDKLTDDEKLLGRSIFSMQGEPGETVYSDNDGNMLMRMSIQSLAPGLEVETPVIDIFASILNHEERFSTKTLKRHYFHTGMMMPGILEIKKLKPEEQGKMIITQYETFQQLLTLQMKEDLPRMQMHDVDLVFFPIISSDHYYVIVFNIQKGYAVIIDNSESDATYEGKYKAVYDLVKGVFLMHLMTYQHPKQEVMIKEFKPKILKMKWRTKQEKTDCGVYMMAHMESYEGETAVAKWKTGLLEEKHKGHREQLDNLRSKYAAKIILHEENEDKIKEMMSEYAYQFAAEYPDEETMKKVVNEAIKQKKEELKN